MSSPRSSAPGTSRRSGCGRLHRCRRRATLSCRSTSRIHRIGRSSGSGRPDALIHLAWGGLPNYASLHHFERELPAHYAVLKRLVEDGLTTLVVAGTCFEYGMQSGPLDETRAAAPANPYALAKDALRRQLQQLQRELPFSLTWARLFYLHGEGQAASALLPQLRRAVAAGKPSFAMSGGEQLRDYLAVEQAADHLVALAGKRREHGIVNVCSGRPVSVRSLVEGWIAANHWSIGLDLGRYPYPEHEPMAFWGDARKLKQCLASVLSLPDEGGREIYSAEQLPVLQNRMFASPEAARACPRGDVVLVQSRATGLVFNAAFRPELVQYDADYQNEQGLSAAFARHLDAVVDGDAAAFRGRDPDRGRLRQGPLPRALARRGFDVTGLDPTYEGSEPARDPQVLHARARPPRRRHRPAPRARARRRPGRVSRRAARVERRRGQDLHRGAVPRLDRPPRRLVRHLLRARQLLPPGRLRAHVRHAA